MGSAVFSSSYSTSIAGYATYNVRVTYSESYSASTNKSTISITGVELQKEGNTVNWGSLAFFGSVTVNGTTLLTMDGGSSVRVSLSGSGYCSVAIPSSSSVEVAHNNDGTGSFTLRVVGGFSFEGDDMFCALYQSTPFGVKTASKTVALTSRGHTLTTTVSPSGYGTVTSGATLANGKTKSLTATPASTTAQYTYAFSSWSVSGTGAKVSSATANPTTFTMGTANATVTANFTRSTRSYTVSCQDRVGSASGTLLGTKTATYAYGSSVSGASFGSSTSYDAYYTGYHYTGSSTAITVDGNETVYRYFALNTWTVSYNANGGSGAPSSQTKTYGINLTLSATVPARTGYDFLGWSKSNTATTATYSAGSTYTANEGAILYAVWKIKTYTISYDANGGSGAPSSQTKTYNVNLTLSSTTPTRTGYDFLGWSTSSTATSATYSAGGTYTSNASATLYAVWRLKTYTVSYNANGHGTAPSSQTKTYGTALTLRSFISNQTGTGTKSDYTITGNANGGTWSGSNGSASRTPKYTYSQNKWNTKSDGTGTGYASGASYTANAATTLYAIWNTSTSYTYTYALPSGTPAKNQTVTVTFNANGGSTTKTSQTSTRAMTFSGWYTSASGGTKRTTASQVSANETVYAHYDDGTSAYPNVTLPTASQCTRTGYTLLGFATSATATSAAYSPGESYTPTAGITLYAVWRIISYSVSASISARGITANILRTASPVAGAASGLLSNGDTIYYNDTVKVSWTISTGYQADTLRINGVDVSSLSEKTVTVASALTVILTVKLGAIVYINGVAYQAFIDNGSNFSAQYEAYIDNGSSWDAY